MKEAVQTCRGGGGANTSSAAHAIRAATQAATPTHHSPTTTTPNSSANKPNCSGHVERGNRASNPASRTSAIPQPAAVETGHTHRTSDGG